MNNQLFSDYVIEQIRAGEFKRCPYHGWSSPQYGKGELTPDDWYLQYSGFWFMTTAKLYRQNVELPLSPKEEERLVQARKTIEEVLAKQANDLRFRS